MPLDRYSHLCNFIFETIFLDMRGKNKPTTNKQQLCNRKFKKEAPNRLTEQQQKIADKSTTQEYLSWKTMETHRVSCVL